MLIASTGHEAIEEELGGIIYCCGMKSHVQRRESAKLMLLLLSESLRVGR